MTRYITSLFILVSMLTSCEKYLSEEPIHYQTADQLLKYENNFEFAINEAYGYLPDGYLRVGSSMLEAAMDDAVSRSDGDDINLIARDLQSVSKPVLNYWADAYKGINQTLLVEENIQNVNIPVAGSQANPDAYFAQMRILWKGEMQALRAYYYFELMRLYGGVPIVTQYMTLADDLSEFKRASFHDMVEHIVGLCDEATDNLSYITHPIAGRFGKGAAQAIKAKTLAYAASDLYNINVEKDYLGYTSGEQAARQARAAEALSVLISSGNWKLSNRYDMFFQGPTIRNANYDIPGEFIVYKGRVRSNTIERALFPPSFGGRGSVFPTQEFVNAFDNLDGTPFDPVVQGAQQWENRDPRLAMNVIFNESVVRGSGATAQRVFTHLGEGQTNDGLGVVSQQSTTTGYYLRKFLDYTNINFDAASPGQTFHLWPLIRYADILLLYAEMMNAAYGPENPHTYGMTAKQAVERVRQRAGITGYLLPEGLSKEPMFEWIKKERRVELCFEEQRFFDLRRWKDVESLKQPVGGLKITKTGDSYTFQQIVVDNARAFTDRMYFQPIPVTETINLGIPQNPGW